MKSYRMLALAALLACSSGCMLQPTNGTKVAHRGAPIDFLGFDPAPDMTITIEALDPEGGDWEAVRTMKSSTLALNGYYQWQDRFSIPTRFWEPGVRYTPSEGWRARIRARSGSSSFALTYEENGFNINDPLGSRSSESPVVTLYTQDWLQLGSQLTAEEREALAYTNFARTDPQGFAQSLLAARAAAGTDNGAHADLMNRSPVPALVLHSGLIQAAKAHSRDMHLNCGNMQHQSCNGTSAGTRIMSYYSGSTWGENIAAGFSSGKSLVLDLIIDQGVSSLGHRRNILDPAFRHIGIGSSGLYWTQDFGG